MADLKALIFDVDGTLAETERDGHRVAFNQTFGAAGLDWHWSIALYGQLLNVTGGKERIRYYLELEQPLLPAGVDITALIADLHQAKTQRYRALVESGQVQLRPGIRRLIASARAAEIRLAIATTSHFDNAIALLETTLGPDSPSWFEVIAAGDVVPHKKPAPDIYHYVLEKLQLNPAHCLVLEDTDHGLMSAHGAGLTTVITVSNYTRQQNFATAGQVLEHLGEPGQPTQVLAGPALAKGYFDLATAERLLDSNQ
ncbi:MAG: HAD family hydrolase [Cyanobacteria bacterium]|nr:HAD family hydrolase [Cyanobacteriota bacterium]MDA0867156.1 HAD family hydrolase [Cyanobacteriota bacterium]